MIKTGRYGNSKTSREQRKCQVCDLDEVENEEHLILTEDQNWISKEKEKEWQISGFSTQLTVGLAVT